MHIYAIDNMANVRFSNGMRLASVYIASRTHHACMFQPMTATHYPTSSRFPSDFFELFDNIDMLHSNRHTRVCNVKCRFLNEHYFSPKQKHPGFPRGRSTQMKPFRDACVDVGSGDGAATRRMYSSLVRGRGSTQSACIAALTLFSCRRRQLVL